MINIFSKRNKMAERRYGLRDPDARVRVAAVESQWRRSDSVSKGIAARAGAAEVGLHRINTGISLFTILKPFIIGGVILLFVIGPGLAAVLQVFGAMSWWLWAIAIIILIGMWRS